MDPNYVYQIKLNYLMYCFVLKYKKSCPLDTYIWIHIETADFGLEGITSFCGCFTRGK